MTGVYTKWDAQLYNDKHAFVFRYGEDLVELLNPKSGERILDLGSGTGYLTNRIAASGAYVTGIDSSADMIEKAREEYPDLDFHLLSATDFSFEEPFDAVFSNATLHWILDKQFAIDRIYENLKPNGRLVLEMGGKDNVKAIATALKTALGKKGFRGNAERAVWYFPSLGEYSSLLENRGFRVTYAAHFDRETELKDDQNGIRDWIRMFGSLYLEGLNEKESNQVLNDAEDLLRPTQFRGNSWWADYKRLRIIAIKQ